MRADGSVFRLYNIPRHRMNVIFVFVSVSGKFQLKDRGPIIMIKFLILKYRIRCIDIRLSQGNFLCLLQSDIGRWLSVFGISRVIIVVANCHNIRSKV